MFRRVKTLFEGFEGSEWDGDALAGFQDNPQAIATLARALRQGKRTRQELYRFIDTGFPGSFTCSDTKIPPYHLLRLIFEATAMSTHGGQNSLPILWELGDGLFANPSLNPLTLLQWVEQLGIARYDMSLLPETGGPQAKTFVPNGNPGESVHRVTAIKHTFEGTKQSISEIETMLDEEYQKIRGDVSLAVSLLLLSPEHLVPGQIFIFSGAKLGWRDFLRNEQTSFVTVKRGHDGTVWFGSIPANAPWSGALHRSVRVNQILS